METPAWEQTVLLASQDREFKQKISAAFSSESKLIVVADSEEAVEHYQKEKIKVLLIDSESFKDRHKRIIHSDYISLCENIQKENDRLVIIVFVNKPPSADILSQMNQLGVHGLIDRKDFTAGTIQYLIRIFRSRSFRTLVIDDFNDSYHSPSTLYHFLPMNNRYIPILEKNSPFTDKVRDKLIQANSFQVYAQQKDYTNILNALRESNPSRELISVHLNQIRDLYIKYLSHFFGISKGNHLKNGKVIFEQGEQIVSLLLEVMSIFPNPMDCIKQLAYKRWSDISHSLNCAIYILIFGKELKISKYKEVAHIALFHNIGMSQINQEIATKDITQMTLNEKLEYQKHVEYSVFLLKKLRMPLNLWNYAVVYQHHECFDGSGYPRGTAGEKILPQSELLSLSGAFNHVLSIHNEARFLNIQEAWEKLCSQNSFESKQTTQAFSPDTLEKLSFLINQTEENKENETAEEASDSGSAA